VLCNLRTIIRYSTLERLRLEKAIADNNSQLVSVVSHKCLANYCDRDVGTRWQTLPSRIDVCFIS